MHSPMNSTDWWMREHELGRHANTGRPEAKALGRRQRGKTALPRYGQLACRQIEGRHISAAKTEEQTMKLDGVKERRWGRIYDDGGRCTDGLYDPHELSPTGGPGAIFGGLLFIALVFAVGFALGMCSR
jgi:hypothetical protein